MKVSECKLSEQTGKKYGIKISYLENDEIKVSYLYDAESFRPLPEGYSDWQDVWFIKDNKPAVLSYNCRNINYLENINKDMLLKYELHGNIMSQIPKVYISIQTDELSETIIVSDTKHDESYKCIAHTDSLGNEKDFLYISSFQVSKDHQSMFRSIADKMVFKSCINDIDLKAFTIFTGDNYKWDFVHWNSQVLLRYLLMILFKTDNISSIIGKCVNDITNKYTSKDGIIPQFKLVDRDSKNNYMFYIENFISDDIIHYEGIHEQDKKIFVDNQLVIEFNDYIMGKAKKFISTYFGRFPILESIDESLENDNLITYVDLSEPMVRFMETDHRGISLSKVSLLNLKGTKETYFLQHL